jgi:hypothetical protein
MAKTDRCGSPNPLSFNRSCETGFRAYALTNRWEKVLFGAVSYEHPAASQIAANLRKGQAV